MKENELQREIYALVRDGKLAEHISSRGVRSLKGFIKAARTESYEFSMIKILRDRYAKSALWIYRKLSEEIMSIIGGENTSNISLNGVERLYPDILAHNEERNFFLFELKVGSKTEREAITEIFVYIFEVRNHLPGLNIGEISIIIISESFGVLLSHAVMQLIGFYGVKVICLRARRHQELILELYNPSEVITDNEVPLSKESFSTCSLVLYHSGQRSRRANQDIMKVFNVAEGMLLERANQLGSNGFLVLYRNSLSDDWDGCVARFYITIAIINPFKLLDELMLGARTTPLAKRLYEMYLEESDHLQNHFGEIVEECEDFLGKFYNVSRETYASYDMFERSVVGWDSYALRCNSWGEFGRFVRGITYGGSNAYGFFDSERDHTDPIDFFETLNNIFECGAY
ncbi:hypothetical protein [Azotobacter vinelandii]|uniref:hypothetical protein n=1 Tax=Azotobacter vinelandii TaxID=354 RepID=UPI000AD844AE|nr:hypothetical protein [Azotobacter vinelandii]